MVTTTRRVTLEELERDGGPEGLWEVIDGELVEMPPSGGEHSRLGLRIGRLIGNYVDDHGLGYVYGADGGFILVSEPLTLRSPDFGFVRRERLPADFDDSGYLPLVPDFSVEVLSRFGNAVAALAKVVAWLEAGVAVVWLVDAKAQTATVFDPESTLQVLTINQTLDGGDVLPGFSLPVRNIFAQ